MFKFWLCECIRDFTKIAKFSKNDIIMNKKLCAWIEGDGTFRTLFRKVALWDFSSADRCKVQLLIAIEKEK